MHTLVEFSTAILAKEKGYNELGLYYQWNDEKSPTCALNYNVKNEWHTQEKYVEIEGRKKKYTITIPTQEELRLWILKNHFIHILILPTITCCWTFKILDVQCNPSNQIERPPYNDVNGVDYPKYEQALEEALKEVLTKTFNK